MAGNQWLLISAGLTEGSMRFSVYRRREKVAQRDNGMEQAFSRLSLKARKLHLPARLKLSTDKVACSSKYNNIFLQLNPERSD